MKRAFTFIFLLVALLPVLIHAQCTLANFTSVGNIGPGGVPFVSTSGITVSVSAPGVPTLGNTSYTCSGQTFACAATAWWPNAVPHIITVNFSAPISKFSVVINGTNQGEVFTFVGNSGATTLSDYCVANFSTVAANQLIDNVAPATGTLITINNSSGATSYTITHNGVGSGSRISLLNCIVPASPFDVSMASFVAQYQPELQDVQLDWEAQHEGGFNGFEVQHSLDGQLWDVLGFVPAIGNSNTLAPYRFLHPEPMPGANHYRLRKVDLDANYTFSEVQTIEIAQAGGLATIFPNPTAGLFEVRATGRRGSLEVTDMLGRHITTMPFDSQLQLDLGDQAPGIYWIKILDQEHRASIQRLVLQ